MAVTLAATPQLRMSLGYNATGSGTCGYNNSVYDAVNNPGGMDGNGVAINWINLCNDMVALGINLASLVNFATAAAVLQAAWMQETNTVTRMSATQLAITGYRMDVAGYGRAVQLVQSANATGYVTDAQYNSATGETFVTLYGCTIDTGLTELWWGQDPANSPLAAVMSAATGLLSGFGGSAPKPLAGQQNDTLAGDATYHCASVDIEAW